MSPLARHPAAIPGGNPDSAVGLSILQSLGVAQEVAFIEKGDGLAQEALVIAIRAQLASSAK